MGEAICITTVALDSSTATVRTREAAIGNLFADAMRDGMHADAAILNGGGIRAGKIYAAGRAHHRKATSWPSCRSTTASWWWRSPAPN